MSAQSAGLAGVLRAVQESVRDGSLPPVHQWHPQLCEGIEMQIDAKGRWYFMGSPIGRERMVRLFSTVLRKDPDGHYLVTPVEKILVRVERTPFQVVSWEPRGLGGDTVVACVTDVGDRVEVGPEHPVTVAVSQAGERFPQVEVRSGLMAAIHRNCYYQMVDWAARTFGGGGGQGSEGEDAPLRFRSHGRDWPLG